MDLGQKSVTIATDREITFNPGDLLTFYAQDTERLGTQTITKMYSVEEPNEISGKTSKIATDFKYDDADFMKVRLLAPSCLFSDCSDAQAASSSGCSLQLLDEDLLSLKYACAVSLSVKSPFR